jgi:signal transduction histidine kinase
MTSAAGGNTLIGVDRGFAGLRGFRINLTTLDSAIAAVLTVVAQLAIWVGTDAAGHKVAGAVLAVCLTVPIAVRRRYPFLVGTIVASLGSVDHVLWNTSSIAYPLSTFLALYALAVWTATRHFLAGTFVVIAVAFGASAVSGGSVRGTAPFVVVVLIVMLLVRRVVGDRERRARMAERERDVASREAVLEERARIARELHDVIAHNVSMMVIQAGAERRDAERKGGGNRDAFESIERTGRGALTEMRRLVGMLRSDGEEPLAPQPSLHDLAHLVAETRAAGMPVDLQVDGRRRDLPAGIELSGYRIVQEALTNALKHADQTSASVRVHYGPDALELEVTNTGNGVAGSGPGTGHGLIGMRERAALCGGDFDAYPLPGGGFSVRVRLPIR